jgi:transcriptional regulator with XRE-family HTH domain
MERSGDRRSRYDYLVPQSATPGPAVLKKRLGEELRSLRLAADVTIAQVASELGCQEGKVRHIESGRTPPSKPDLTVMIGLYGAPAEVHQALEELRQAATTKGWWASYRLPPWLQNYVGMEADASLIRIFALELVPGLLQIEAYAHEVHTLGPKIMEPAMIDKRVAARLKRQERLTAEDPPTFHAVISEAALHRLRGAQYAAEQYRHLLAMAKRPNITVNVLPFSQRLHQCMAGGFTLLDFPAGVSAPIAYFDYAIAGQLEPEAKIVSQLSDVYNQLIERSLGDKDSAEFIAEWI